MSLEIFQDLFTKDSLHEILRLAMGTVLAEGAHGYMHAFRTARIACEINRSLANPAESIPMICAAALHDIGRIDDRGDPLHGFRGVPRAIKVLGELLMPNIVTDRTWWDIEEIQGKVASIIARHCLGIKGVLVPEKIVWDADKLDRYRLKPENWPDPDRLDLDESRNLMPWAKQYVRGEGG